MAKPQVFIAFHAGEPFGATVDAAREQCAEAALRGMPAFPPNTRSATGVDRKSLFASLGKAANALGIAVLIAASNDRLIRAFDEPQERKAIFDGVSRGRFVPSPIAAFGAELKLLSPLEVADEVRLNFELWRRTLITAPIARPPRTETRITLRTADPATELSSVSLKGSALIVVNADEMARGGDLENAFARLVAALKARHDTALASVPAQGQYPAAYEAMLRDVFTSGSRADVLELPPSGGFDSGRAGFPLDLARALAPPSAAARTLCSAAGSLLARPLVFGALDAKVARGLLLRKLASGFGGGASIPDSERLRASFTLAVALLERITLEKPEEATPAAEVAMAVEIIVNLERALEAAEKGETIPRGPAAEERVADAKKAKTRALRLLPKTDAEAPPRGEFLGAVRKAAAAAAQCAFELTAAAAASSPVTAPQRETVA